MPSTYTPEEDEQLHHDILVIGKAMLKAAKELSSTSGRPLYDYSQAVIQSLIIVHPLIIEDEPYLVELRKASKDLKPSKK